MENACKTAKILKERGRAAIRQTLRRWSHSLLCLLTALLLLTSAALAASNGRLVLESEYTFSGLRYDIYRVSDLTVRKGQYVLTNDFSDYQGAPLTASMSASQWSDAATTLESYAASKSLTPAAFQTTVQGRAEFNNLETGLYLVSGAVHKSGGYTYTSAPFLVVVDGESVTAALKYSRTGSGDGGGGGGGGDDKSSYTVTKIWSGDDAASRPDSITIQILKDGKVYSTLTLSESNRWTYTWNSSDTARWTVAEPDVPQGYTVSITRLGDSFTVTNTYKADGEPDNPGGGGDGGGSTPGGTTDPSQPEQPATPDQPHLPQTGQLWWPVALLSLGGLVMLTVGGVYRKKNQE